MSKLCLCPVSSSTPGLLDWVVTGCIMTPMPACNLAAWPRSPPTSQAGPCDNCPRHPVRSRPGSKIWYGHAVNPAASVLACSCAQGIENLHATERGGLVLKQACVLPSGLVPVPTSDRSATPPRRLVSFRLPRVRRRHSLPLPPLNTLRPLSSGQGSGANALITLGISVLETRRLGLPQEIRGDAGEWILGSADGDLANASDREW